MFIMFLYIRIKHCLHFVSYVWEHPQSMWRFLAIFEHPPPIDTPMTYGSEPHSPTSSPVDASSFPRVSQALILHSSFVVFEVWKPDNDSKASSKW